MIKTRDPSLKEVPVQWWRGTNAQERTAWEGECYTSHVCQVLLEHMEVVSSCLAGEGCLERDT